MDNNYILENIEYLIDEITEKSKKEIKKFPLSSIMPQDELNPKIWLDNGLLNSRVRLRLLDIADEFIENLEIDWVEIKDIILTGSLANYNWSKYSDFDLHIIIDFNDIIGEHNELVSDYVNSKKKIWNNEHDTLKIYGFPIEIYVQDINETHSSSGVYSLEKNEWLIKPQRSNFENVSINKNYIKRKINDIIDIIDGLHKNIKKEEDEYKLEELSKKVKGLFDKLRGLRKDSLKKDGEYGEFNIIYKLLRRLGYLDKLYDLKLSTYDKIKSLN